MENSPEYEAKMEAYRKKSAREASQAKKALAAAVKAGHGMDWTPIDKCPFAAFCLWSGTNDAILVTDGETVTVARISKRFGAPVFYKKEPETIYRDGMMWSIGGEEDPRPDLPKWWWTWEIKDELERETWAYGEPAGQPEVDFVATHWRFLPAPPMARRSRGKSNG